MKDYVPLVQTALWVILALILIRSLGGGFRDALVERVKSGSSLKLGPVELGELRQEVESVRGEVDQLSSQVSKLFLLAMSPEMYANLGKLARGKFGEYWMSEGLRRELRHLRDLGYIEVYSIGSIPDTGDELLDHVSVTEAGRRFVRLREGMSPLGD